MRSSLILKSSRRLRLFGRPVMARLDARDGLWANAEPMRDQLLLLAGFKSRTNQAIPLIEKNQRRFPFSHLGEHEVSGRSLDVEIGPNQLKESFTFGCVLDDQDVATAPIRLLLLRANDAKTQAITYADKHGFYAIRQDDSQPAFRRSRQPAFAIGKACDVGSERFLSPIGEVHTVIIQRPHSSAIVPVIQYVGAVTVPTIEYLGQRIAAAVRRR